MWLETEDYFGIVLVNDLQRGNLATVVLCLSYLDKSLDCGED
jgi:hypothetical protein